MLTLDSHVSLSGHVLEFISLDGNVSLSLLTDSATVDSTAGTYSWSMASQPWENGDQLMLRIREVGTEIFLNNIPSRIEQGAVQWFMVKAVNLDKELSSHMLSLNTRSP